jgi:hypothetical protein
MASEKGTCGLLRKHGHEGSPMEHIIGDSRVRRL